MPVDIRSQLVSGKAKRLTSPVQLPAGSKVALVLIGAAPGFLERMLSSNLLRRKQVVRVAVAPRQIRIPNRSGIWPNPGWAEASQARKDGLLSRVVTSATADLKGAGAVADLTTAAELCMALVEKLSPAQRHSQVLATLASLVPQQFASYDAVITVIELPAEEKPAAARLTTVSGPVSVADHVLRELVTKGPGLAGIVLDSSLLLLLSPDGKMVTRLDPDDKRTSVRTRQVSIVGALGKLYGGMPLEGDEAAVAPSDGDEVGEPEVTQASAPAPQEVPTSRQDGAVAPSGTAPQQTPPSNRLLASPVPPNPPTPELVAPRVQPDPSLTPAMVARAKVHTELRASQVTSDFPTRSGRATTLGAILSTPAISPITVRVAPGEFLDPSLARPRFDAVVSSYLEKGHYDRDLASVLVSLSSDPDFPVFVQDVEREDTSDALNHRETVSFTYRTGAGRPGRARFDLPVFSRDGYMYLNGIKYGITKQILPLPVIKVSAGEVLITTAYNKAIVSRFGQVASTRSAYIRQLATFLDKERPSGIRADLGSATGSNAGFLNTVEYDDVARTVRSIRAPGAAFIFSRSALDHELPIAAPWSGGAVSAVEDSGGHAVGWRDGGASVLAVDSTGHLLELREAQSAVTLQGGLDDALHSVVASSLPDGAATPPAPSGRATRKTAYARVKMLSQWLPAAVICGFADGLEIMLKKSGTPFKFLPVDIAGGHNLRMSLPPGHDWIRFTDGILLYETAELRHTLVANGLKEMDTESRAYGDYGPGGIGWVDFVTDRLGSPGHAKALKNFQISFIDPMTAELLASDGLPTDMSGVLLYATSLLETNQHRDANDLANYRLRGPEMVHAILYKILHREMERVRATRESSVPQRLSLAQGEVVKQIMAASNTEEVADLNPLLELELRGKASWTGAAGGMGDGRTVNRAMRSYHPSMMGIFGYYSPDSAEIGVKRALSFGAAIVDTRGRMIPGGTGLPGAGVLGKPAAKDTEGIGPPDSATRILATGELLSSFTAQHADPPRFWASSR